MNPAVDIIVTTRNWADLFQEIGQEGFAPEERPKDPFSYPLFSRRSEFRRGSALVYHLMARQPGRNRCSRDQTYWQIRHPRSVIVHETTRTYAAETLNSHDLEKTAALMSDDSKRYIRPRALGKRQLNHGTSGTCGYAGLRTVYSWRFSPTYLLRSNTSF